MWGYTVTCVHQRDKGKERLRPDVDESEQFRVFDISWIFQSLKKIIQNWCKLLALFILSRCKEQQQDAVFKDRDNLALCVELILVPVVLHQDMVEEQVHHDETTAVGKGLKAHCGEKRC